MVLIDESKHNDVIMNYGEIGKIGNYLRDVFCFHTPHSAFSKPAETY